MNNDKIADLGLDVQQVGRDLSAALGGNYVNRFSMDGRSYKVIPQISRTYRLNPDQLNTLHVSGPNGSLIPLNLIASLEDSIEPRSLNRFQQLNAIKLSGITTRTVETALSFLEEQADAILPRGYVVDYTGESRQLYFLKNACSRFQLFYRWLDHDFQHLYSGRTSDSGWIDC